MITEEIRGHKALKKLVLMHEQFNNVLDIGSGQGEATEVFKRLDKNVTTIDNNPIYKADYKTHFIEYARNHGYKYPKFDCVWCSHVLEHQPNVNQFLTSINYVLAEGGLLALTVPPRKDQIVGGHLTLWNSGLLLYNVIMAGFDCSQAMVKQYGYNISLIVKKKKIKLPKLQMDKGDIETLAPFFPMPVKQGFNGDIKEINW